MIVLNVITSFVVCTSLINASPSAIRVDGESIDCVKSKATNPVPTAQCEEQIAKAKAPLHQKLIQCQSQTIQDLLKHSQTPPSVHCSHEIVSNAVRAAVVPLQETIQELKQTILKLTQSTCDEQVKRAVSISQETMKNRNIKNQDIPTPEPPTPTTMIPTSTMMPTTTMIPTTTMMSTTTLMPTTTPIPTITLAPHGCDSNGYKYYPRAARCYKKNEEDAIWTDAAYFCRKSDGNLATISSEEDGQVLGEIVKKGGNGCAFINLALFGGIWKPRFLFNDSSEYWFVENLWDVGYPLFADQNIYAAVCDNGKLINVPSDWKLSFICEKIPTL